MIALPLVLAKIGLIPSVLLMVGMWFIMYYTSLVNLELNLQAGRGLSLGALGRFFSGRTAELIGTISIKLLSYSLLAVFIYGGSSVLQELMASKMTLHYSFDTIATWYALISIAASLNGRQSNFSSGGFHCLPSPLQFWVWAWAFATHLKVCYPKK